MIFSHLRKMKERHNQLSLLLSSPEVIEDRDRYRRLAQEYGEIKKIVEKFKRYEKVLQAIDEGKSILKDKDRELAKLAAEELENLQQQRVKMEEELRSLMEPGHNDEKRSAIVEIRAGVGGNEASLFAADLFQMYTRYAERRGWTIEMMGSHPTEVGGFKEIIFVVSGNESYKVLQYEGGIHRVQRVPTTETQGRTHTSTVTVAILLEAATEDVEVKISPDNLRIDTYRASGAGGQHVNVTDSAVRITHIPTGIVVQCQDERSQQKNRSKAMRVLRARILDHHRKEAEKKTSNERKSQLKSGERSEKTRTYNFLQNRITDHRAGFSLHNLDEILKGDMDKLLAGIQSSLSK
ncbi:peptide chain release factor 1 [candidate division NPL-UPA2 bacterium Unc8]|uniref:Peptide chain release factor 1 n=1 Tax=candidate division NPL-UPA2 bacterium Unc8 TaxID=1980939 RepID=A0A399FVW4_UNCN2|nr:Peptide chain release factor 1 [Bacillota bacterium]MBT9138878.1 Peptide chain release factor 1 [Bacillota bacterium]MBT9146925.1 Peptide chain release factor 1 [Bacillota bacterium]RII00575.1 MAG: peptide chain release factor 1 [candidate division NPL-UPA2 bacterium Unc8]